MNIEPPHAVRGLWNSPLNPQLSTLDSMHDQANDLRDLARRCAGTEVPAPGRRPRTVVLSSGKGGVGTTTIAVQLAVAMARSGRRVALVDADPRGGDVALLCGIEEQHTLADVLAGRRTVAEVLQPGPGGVEVLPGVWGWDCRCDYPPAAGERLLGQLQTLGKRADVVVLDTGNGLGGMKRRFWQAADLRLVVTTTETAAILDTYASIKAMAGTRATSAIYTLVNLCPCGETGENVHARLAHACQRFLAFEPHPAGHIAADPEIAAAGRTRNPLMPAATEHDARTQFDRLAQMMADRITLGIAQKKLRQVQMPHSIKPRPLVAPSDARNGSW